MYEEKHKDAQRSRETVAAREQQLAHSVHVVLGLVALVILLAAAMYFLPSETGAALKYCGRLLARCFYVLAGEVDRVSRRLRHAAAAFMSDEGVGVRPGHGAYATPTRAARDSGAGAEALPLMESGDTPSDPTNGDKKA